MSERACWLDFGVRRKERVFSKGMTCTLPWVWDYEGFIHLGS